MPTNFFSNLCENVDKIYVDKIKNLGPKLSHGMSAYQNGWLCWWAMKMHFHKQWESHSIFEAGPFSTVRDKTVQMFIEVGLFLE